MSGLSPFAYPLLWNVDLFSLRSCRSSSVFFSLFQWGGGAGKFCGKVGENLAGSFRTHQNKGSKKGAKNETLTFFVKLFGHSRDIPAKSQDIPPKKKFDFPGFEGHIELVGPHPFTWKTPTPPENIQTQKLGFVLLFSCLKKYRRQFRSIFHKRTRGSNHSIRAKIPSPEFAQPRLSRVKARVVPSERVQIWVCLFLDGRS